MLGECQVNVKSQSELDIGGRETCYFCIGSFCIKKFLLGLSTLNTSKLEPKTCSKRTCFHSESLIHSAWISSKVLIFLKYLQILIYFFFRRRGQVVIAAKLVGSWLMTSIVGLSMVKLMVRQNKTYQLKLNQ